MLADPIKSIRHPRVLVVEDEARLRELLADVIPDMGFAAAQARTAEEAVRVMEADPREILLLDLRLPGMSGLDLFRLVRARWPASQVIILTAHGDLEAARAAIRLDVVDFLPKPCRLDDIEAALGRARTKLLAAVAPPGRGMVRIAAGNAPGPAAPTLAEVERRQILDALRRNGGNRTRAAHELGISRRKLHYRLREYGRSDEGAAGDTPHGVGD